VFEIAPSAK
nr:RecName: Full=Non-symbiotic hemoglobin [Pseudotsuga menziesii]